MAKSSAPLSAASNVKRYYAYRFLADFALWAGVWIKYLTVDRGLELRWILLMDLPFWLCPCSTSGDAPTAVGRTFLSRSLSSPEGQAADPPWQTGRVLPY